MIGLYGAGEGDRKVVIGVVVVYMRMIREGSEVIGDMHGQDRHMEYVRVVDQIHIGNMMGGWVHPPFWYSILQCNRQNRLLGRERGESVEK